MYMLLSCALLPACSLLNNDIDDDPPSRVHDAPSVVAGDGARTMTIDGSVSDGASAQDGGEDIEYHNPAPKAHSTPPAAQPPSAPPASMDAGARAPADGQLEPEVIVTEPPPDAAPAREMTPSADEPDDDASCETDPKLCPPAAPVDSCTDEPASCTAPARCLTRDGTRRCVCPGYYDDVNGDGSQCLDHRFVSIAAFGGADANLGYSITSDGAGDLYVAGAFQNQIAFGSLPAHNTAGDFDVYVAKLDRDGTPLWSRRFGASGDDRGFRIAAGRDGGVVVVGAIQDSVAFDGISLGSAGVASGYVAKLSTRDGAVLWAHPLPRTPYYAGTGQDHAAPLDGWPSDVAVDADDGVYVTGPFAEAFDFGGLRCRQPAGLVASYLVKYEAGGALAGFHIFDSSGTTMITALAIDHSANVVLTGLVDGAADFDGGEGDRYGLADAFVMKLSSAGKRLWSTRVGSTAFDCGMALTVTEADDIVAVGTFDANLSWGNVGLSAGPARSIYLARLKPDGTPIWLTPMDSEDFYTRGLAVNALPNGFALAGTFRSSLDFGDGTRLQTAALQDMFVARFASDGSPSWAQAFGGANYDEAWDLVVDASGNLSVTGWFAGPVSFGASATPSPTPSTGWLAVPVLRLRP